MQCGSSFASRSMNQWTSKKKKIGQSFVHYYCTVQSTSLPQFSIRYGLQAFFLATERRGEPNTPRVLVESLLTAGGSAADGAPVEERKSREEDFHSLSGEVVGGAWRYSRSANCTLASGEQPHIEFGRQRANAMSDEQEARRKASLEKKQQWEREQQDKLVKEDLEAIKRGDKNFMLGMIEESGYLCVGDPYQEPGSAFDGGSRTKGLNFKISGTKKGKWGKGTNFGPLNPTCIGDKYQSRQERLYAEKKAKRLAGRKLRKEARKAAQIKAGKDIADVDNTDPPPWVPAPPKRKVEEIFLARVDKSTDDAEVLRLLRKERAEFISKVPKAGEQESHPPNIKVSLMKTNIIDAVTQYEWIPARDDAEPTKAEKMKQKRLADL